MSKEGVKETGGLSVSKEISLSPTLIFGLVASPIPERFKILTPLGVAPPLVVVVVAIILSTTRFSPTTNLV